MTPEYNYYPLNLTPTGTTVATLPSTDNPQPNTQPAPLPETNIVPTSGGSTMNGGALESPNHVDNQQGWRVGADGNADFQDITARVLYISRRFVAGEAITDGDAVVVSDGETLLVPSAANATANQNETIATAAHWRAQTFLTSANAKKIKSVMIGFSANLGPSGTATISLRAVSSNVPTGADIETKTATASIIGGQAQDLVFTFTSAVTVSASTTYAVVLRLGTVSEYKPKYNTSSTYANGNWASSTDSGAGWTADTDRELVFTVNEIQRVTGYVYKAEADKTDSYTNFIGFATETVASLASLPVNVGGIVESLSGLSIGSTYFLSDTAGAIATTAGTNSVKIGTAISTTEILIKYDNG